MSFGIFAWFRHIDTLVAEHDARLGRAESKLMTLQTQEAALAAEVTTITGLVDTLDGHLADQQTQITALQAKVDEGATGADLQPLIDQLTASNAKAQAAIAALPVPAPPATAPDTTSTPPITPTADPTPAASPAS